MSETCAAASGHLTAMCEAAESKTGVRLGGRAWLLPRWYTIAHQRNRRMLLAYAELTKFTVQRPRMYAAAVVYGDLASTSNARWPVSKGLLGQLTFGDLDFRVVQHQDLWPPDLDDMTERRWKQMDPTIRLSRTLEEARSLKRLYGTVVGVPIIDRDSSARLGCMTLHSPSANPLSESAADEVAVVMRTRVNELARQIVTVMRLRNALTI